MINDYKIDNESIYSYWLSDFNDPILNYGLLPCKRVLLLYKKYQWLGNIEQYD